MICSRCKGTGQIVYPRALIKLFPMIQKCPDCDGKGEFLNKPWQRSS